VVASTTGAASPGSYSVEVLSLAREQRTYTNAFSSATSALGQSGTLAIGVGAGSPTSISVDAGDSLETIAQKINAAGGRFSASVVDQGADKRLQLRGLDTGAANALSIDEGGLALGLTTPANTVQSASDASVRLDGFTISRADNRFVGVVPGVSFTVTKQTTSAATLSVAADPAGLRGKLQKMVDAYNGVTAKLRELGGTSQIKATNPVLSGDASLRSIGTELSRSVSSTDVGTGNLRNLRDIGLTLQRDGTLALDGAKLERAMTQDAAGVATLLGGGDTFNGVADVMRELADSFTAPSSGLLATRKTGLEGRAKLLESRVDSEQARLDRYADSLRRQFTAMDTTVSRYRSQSEYLANTSATQT
jgi:flagellar hook-associated protein 2